MTQRLQARFEALQREGRKALVCFVTAGDPDLETTAALLDAVAQAGADVIELGVPFSDPVADGPVIQRASQRALAAGTTLGDVLGLARGFRARSEVPLILFGYCNPFLAFGWERLAQECAECGVDGVLVVDLPPEEAGELRAALEPKKLSQILLVSPVTRAERVERICGLGSGFLYMVSMAGVTGSALQDLGPMAQTVERVRASSGLPICVGFGISTPEDAARVARYADGVVVGSALVATVEREGRGAVAKVAEQVSALREALER